MIPLDNIKDIEEQERKIGGYHPIILLFIKPSDIIGREIVNKINYYHHRSRGYCSIYLVGYSNDFKGEYLDAIDVNGVDNKLWQYSDSCFIGVCEILETRLKHWHYVGEPQLILLQSSINEDSASRLNFQYYKSIDIYYGINELKLFSSAERFMEEIILACKQEMEINRVADRINTNRINLRNILMNTLKNDRVKLPKSIKKILKDKLFFKNYKDK